MAKVNCLVNSDAWKMLKDEYDYEKNGPPENYAAGSSKKVWWICKKKKCHKWEAAIQGRTGARHYGCPICSNHQICPTDHCNSIVKADPKLWETLKGEYDCEKNGPPENYMVGSHAKVWWICQEKKCHRWEAVINSRTGKNRRGCPICSNHQICPTDHCNSIVKADPELWETLKDEYDYKRNDPPENYTVGSKQKVWWICKRKECHRWEAVIGERTGARRYGCPICSNHQICPTDHCNSIVKAYSKLWGTLKDEYDYKRNDPPENYTISSNVQVWWICKKKKCHKWKTAIYDRTGKNQKGCPICNGKKICPTNQCNSIVKTHPELWETLKDEYDYKRNDPPENYTVSSSRKVWWICKRKRCHRWEAVISSRTGKIQHGCPICSNHQICPTDHCNSIVETHPGIWETLKDEYDYKRNDPPENYTISSNRKVWWICKREGCHKWEAVIGERAGKHRRGCPICNGKKICPTDQCNSIVKAHPKMWKTLKDEYDYERNDPPENFTISSRKKVWWICKKNKCHKWEAAIGERTGKHRTGCPICSESKLETECAEALDSLGVKYERQYKDDRCKNIAHLPFDYYLPEYNVLCELQGEQHIRKISYFHKTTDDFIERIATDVKKVAFGCDCEFNVLIISHLCLGNIQSVLNKFINDLYHCVEFFRYRYAISPSKYTEFIIEKSDHESSSLFDRCRNFLTVNMDDSEEENRIVLISSLPYILIKENETMENIKIALTSIEE